jgi:hypothetical protein
MDDKTASLAEEKYFYHVIDFTAVSRSFSRSETAMLPMSLVTKISGAYT